MSAFKCQITIYYHVGVGPYDMPQYRMTCVDVPRPLTFANGVWSTEQLPVRNREAS